jgi:hypothetical protein
MVSGEMRTGNAFYCRSQVPAAFFRSLEGFGAT